jgi:CheY-like chemotaxis protein
MAEAISILKAMAVDVVITDLRMSAIADGLEVAAYVRAHCPGVSLVGASAHAPPIIEDLAFDAFFIKPYNPEDIVSWIRTRCGDSGSGCCVRPARGHAALQQPTKFQLAINLKVAGDLGLTIPPAVTAWSRAHRIGVFQ